MERHLSDVIRENWQVIGFTLGSAWGLIVFSKRALIDNVFATKKELREAKEALESKMVLHEKRDYERYEALSKQMTDNHVEIKDLIIDQLTNR